MSDNKPQNVTKDKTDDQVTGERLAKIEKKLNTTVAALSFLLRVSAAQAEQAGGKDAAQNIRGMINELSK